MSRQPFNTRWAQGVESEDNLNSFKAPGDVRISTGWEGGQDKDAPPAGQENWWHNRVDSALQDIERKGAMAWHPQAIYGLGAPCYATDGYYYESTEDNNANNNPVSSTGYWRQIGQFLYSAFSVGEYKDVAHNGSPDPGWLKCNGSLLLRSAYPKLFDKIGTTYNTGGELSTQFRLPDWRGVFPRCLDEGRGINSGRMLGNAVEQSQNKSHTHNIESWGSTGFDNTGGAYAVTADVQGSRTGDISTQSSGGDEARPINLAQVRWIRYL
ncbi:hypothetical protein B0E42_12900 [Pseudomonas sp. A25(2017)]|uniref:phage tail protein n=1 Tax=Pseudomonas sp. A25(2017) TaxID=1945865 RepID=UPI000987B117|nr:phage tail protein [Pseudomonas sp. A25(2017)]OOG85696.1 hypothetical protein B0E42_12900 [Pseudomonas sp. A25(2017)]